MKKQLISLMLSTSILTISPLFATDVLNEPSKTNTKTDRTLEEIRRALESDWAKTIETLIYPKGLDNLVGRISNQAIAEKDPKAFFQQIFGIWWEDSRPGVIISSEREPALELQNEINNLRIRMTEQLLESPPITSEQKQEFHGLLSRYSDFSHRAFTSAPALVPRCDANELPNMDKCSFIQFPAPIDLHLLRDFERALLHDRAFRADHLFFARHEHHKSTQFREAMIESHKNWSNIHSRTAINRLTILISLCPSQRSLCSSDELLNHCLDLIHDYYKSPPNPEMPAVAVAFQTYQAFLEFDKANRIPKKGPFHILMNLAPTPKARAFFADGLDHDLTWLKRNPTIVQDYLRQDYQPTLPQSFDEALSLLNTFELHFRDSYKACKFYECLKVMYESQGLNSFVLDAVNFELEHKFKHTKDPWGTPWRYKPVGFEDFRQKLIKELDE